MSTIRKQSIVSSILVYFGFALGFLNTYLFTRKGSGLSAEQFGLTNTFIALASIMFSVASFGMPAFIGKFFPYYKAHAEKRKNDQLAWALLITLIGYLIVVILGLVLKPILIDKWFSNSPELPKYFNWVFLFAFGYTVYMILEAYAWQNHQAILTNFLKEVLFRFFMTLLIVATTYGVVKNFDVFVGFYSLSYLAIGVIVMLFFIRRNQFHLTLTVSKVTRRIYRKVITFVSFIWGSSLVLNVASVFDGIIIAAVMPNGLAWAGIYYLAQNISSLMQAPQRAIVSASIGAISQAWKDKDLPRLSRIYHRSSINQLLFSCAMFCLIWLNFEDGIRTFHLQEKYVMAKWIFFYIGLTKIIDMGTGLNAQIIGTSSFWRFEFLTGVILLTITLPMNYEMTRYIGVTGPAISNLIAMTIYNTIRYFFLLKKFRLQPFTIKSLWTLILAGVLYFLCYFLFHDRSGMIWIILRSTLFATLFIGGSLLLKISPDIIPVLQTVRKRLKF